ncbi:coiled-coil-helix-coiled-coil-helix domain-containing protein [archaeon]|nr:MAG: coiled-coil-helix-coiled-coil-helix domain-containing protein [archaeon]
MNAFGGSRVQTRAPERGVFPLDHDGECKVHVKAFLECLKEHDNDHYPCKDFSKAFLKCRMERNLMAPDDLDNLGFSEGKGYVRKPSDEHGKESKGFVAGLTVRGSNKWSFAWTDKGSDK